MFGFFFHITSLKVGLPGQKHWFCNVRKSWFPSIFLLYHPQNMAVLPTVAWKSQMALPPPASYPRSKQGERRNKQEGALPKSGKQHFYKNPQKTSIQNSLARTISPGYPKLWGRNEKNVCKVINICSNCPESLNFKREVVTAWICLCRKHGKSGCWVTTDNVGLILLTQQTRVRTYLEEWMRLRENVGTILFLVPRT